MSFEEKNAWIFGAIVVVAYSGYAWAIVSAAGAGPIANVPYVWPMLASMGASILASIVGTIVVAVSAPKDADKRDERDTMISRYGDAVGLAVLSVGIVGALALTMAELPHFWIANAIYLSFVVAALAITATRLLAYRRGFAPW